MFFFIGPEHFLIVSWKMMKMSWFIAEKLMNINKIWKSYEIFMILLNMEKHVNNWRFFHWNWKKDDFLIGKKISFKKLFLVTSKVPKLAAFTNLH